MESIKVEALSFAYPKKNDNAISNLDFVIKEGEFVLICGKSGCGKTTLLRLLKPLISPHGNKNGKVFFKGKPIEEYSGREQAEKIGFVMQNPDNQLVTDKVWHELAFGLESLGYKNSEIRTRVSEMATFFGIQTWFDKSVSQLSGGQKQLLNLASVMVMQPDVLILDEPTAQLDPISATEFLQILEKINRELGVTVILSEHRLEEALIIADRALVLDGGRIIADDEPRKVGAYLKSIQHEMYRALPTAVRVYGAVESTSDCPLSVREGRLWLKEYSKVCKLNAEAIRVDSSIKEKLDRTSIIEAKDVWFRYEKELPDVIKGLNLKIFKGEIFAIVGGNGAGKTTALSLISGLNRAYRGEILIKGERVERLPGLYNGIIGALPQNPQSLFVKKTIGMDLMELLSQTKLSKEERLQKIEKAASLCHIESLLEEHPYDLSGGEQQRAALAKLLLLEPEILLLDEPTKGMDVHFKEEFARILRALTNNGITVLMLSHDIEFCAEYADRCAMLFDGSITSENTAREFFKGNSFYTTAANRMAREVLPEAVLADDIILACGGSIDNKFDKEDLIVNTDFFKPSDNSKSNEEIIITKESITKPKKKRDIQIDIKQVEVKDRRLSKRTMLSAILILLTIPLTIYVGIYYLGDRKYYFISLLILLQTMLPFCIVFEASRPRARELITISVLCAIAVAGRAAFFAVPQFKPVIAIVIISGVCFGGEAGFLVGAVSALVSNFFFGQGPWTPWQMFAFGIIGFLAGILFQKGFLRKNLASLCLFGFIATLVIYGGIMNPAAVIMWQNVITWEMLISAYIMGIPFDMIHALSTVVFLYILARPMIEKLERIKIKYGLINTEAAT